MGGGAQFHNQFGDIVWSFPEQIHADECDFADEMNPIPNEDAESCRRATHGFQALAEFDLPVQSGNNDGYIDAQDAAYTHLRLWVDSDHDGVSDPSELTTLAEARVIRLEVHPVENRARDRHGNQLRFRSRAWILKDRGREIPVQSADIFLVLED